MTSSQQIPSHRLYRIQRTADAIHHELALILKKANDPRFSRVTITQVQLSPDFAYAKVFFRLLDEMELKDVQAALKKGTGFFRYELAHAAAFRSVPKITFIYDAPVSRGKNLADLLDPASDDESHE